MTAAGGRSNLQLRVMSAIVLAIVVLALTWAGGFWYRLLSAVIGAAVLYEWTSMVLSKEQVVHRVLLGLLFLPVLALLVIGYPILPTLIVLAAVFVVALIYGVATKSGLWPSLGVLYAGISAISLAALRNDDSSGLAVTIFLFAVVWATDIAAYFVGRKFGGPKLAPSISPGKTRSGAIGGTLGAVIAGLIVAWSYGTSWNIVALFVLILVLSAISQIGDLFESSIKRRCGVKDSSQLIPGHGGVMDRVDGLVAAAAALFILGAVFVSPDFPAHFLFAR